MGPKLGSRFHNLTIPHRRMLWADHGRWELHVPPKVSGVIDVKQ
jgi:hypothetical protein